MTDNDSKTHRCCDCPQEREHFMAELCSSCGRCDEHCHELRA